MAKTTLFVSPGQRFGSLQVVGEVVRNGGCRVVSCLCDCGNEKLFNLANLFSGSSKTCGCRRAITAAENGVRNRKHGGATGGKRTPTYLSWASMRQRCLNPNATGYSRYGGAGIGICPEWAGDDGFSAFLADMGERPEGQTLDRKDNAKGYSPENCRWADMATQKRNRSVARLITYNGETKTAAEWARDVGTHRNNILRRLKRGLPLDQVIRP